MKKLLLILGLCFTFTSLGQTETLQKVVISEGIRHKSKNESISGFGDFIIHRQLEYYLVDSTFRWRKNMSKSFKQLNIFDSSIFH